MHSSDAVIAFDIETVPNADLLRRVHAQPQASDAKIIEFAQQKALEKSQGRSDFLPLAFHQVVVISLAGRYNGQLLLKSKTFPQHNEQVIIGDFFKLIDKLSPVLVSWNGAGFDLPVLHMRALHYCLTAAGFWNGPGDKWHQYTSRYHDAHQDVMNILSHHNARNNSKLETAALACGLPGKMGFGGDQVYAMYCAERFADIANYCELDVLNTYLLWLRMRLLTGKLTPIRHDEECTLVENYLSDNSDQQHLRDFLAEWLRHRPPSAQAGMSSSK